MCYLILFHSAKQYTIPNNILFYVLIRYVGAAPLSALWHHEWKKGENKIELGQSREIHLENFEMETSCWISSVLKGGVRCTVASVAETFVYHLPSEAMGAYFLLKDDSEDKLCPS